MVLLYEIGDYAFFQIDFFFFFAEIHENYLYTHQVNYVQF